MNYFHPKTNIFASGGSPPPDGDVPEQNNTYLNFPVNAVGQYLFDEHEFLIDTNIGINKAYDVSFENPSGRKYIAKTVYYIVRDKPHGSPYGKVVFPMTKEKLKELNEETKSDLYFPKVSDANNFYLHPTNSFINYGGCAPNLGDSQVILQGEIKYDKERNTYFFTNALPIEHFRRYTSNKIFLPPNTGNPEPFYKVIDVEGENYAKWSNIEITDMDVNEEYKQENHPDIDLIVEKSDAGMGVALANVHGDRSYSGKDDIYLSNSGNVVQSPNMNFNSTYFDYDGKMDNKQWVAELYPYQDQDIND